MTISEIGPPVPPVAEEESTPTYVDVARKRRLTRGRLAAVVAAVCVLGGGGTGIWAATRNGGSSSTASPVTVTNENVKVTIGTMKQTVSASGTLEPTNDSDLAFAVSGTVTAVDVTTGQKVVAGQTLATLDSAALADQVSAAQATVTSDEDRLTTDQGDSAGASTIDSDEAQITAAESQLSTAETNLSDATLKATFGGTVASVDLTVDAVVSAGGGSSGSVGSSTGLVATSSNASNSTAANSTASNSTADSSSSSGSSSGGITVISSDSFTLSTSVDDTEVGEVKAGDQVDITPSESTSQVIGTVASVSLIASSSSSSSVAEFPVVIDVTGTPSGIYPGDSATASIIVKQIDNAVEVPTAAISYQNGQATVTKVVDGSHATQDVTTGVSLNGETQITRGLAAGDQIVEQVVKFSGTGGTARSLFGGSSSGRGSGTGTGGGLPSGGFGGPPAGGGFAGSGSGAGG